MFTSSLHILNRLATAMPKLVVASKKEDLDTVISAYLKKTGKTDEAEIDKIDTIEISHIYKEADTPTKENWAKDLASYVSGRNKEIHESIPKPIPPEIVWAFLNADPNKPEIERDHQLASKARLIRAKMLGGKTPSSDEMNFLKEHYPELYAIAKRVEQEMEQFRNQLKNCATEEEKQQLIMQKKSQLMSETKKNLGFVQCMLAAIDEGLKDL